MTHTPHPGNPQSPGLPPLRALLAGGGLLAAVLTLTAIVSGAVLYPQYGSLAIAAAAVAALVCLVSGLLGLLATVWFQGTPQAVSGMLLGILVRMALPMAAALGLTVARSELVAAGVVGLILIHYLVGLLVDTTIAVIVCRSTQSTRS